MQPQIMVRDNQSRVKTGHLEIKKAALRILKRLKCDSAELSILLVDDDEIRSLNKRFRKKDKKTDVLSFPQISPCNTFYPEPIYKDKRPPTSLGDIVISLEAAKVQAREKKYSLKRESCILLIHGILHLLGYDHEGVSAKERQEMKKKERELFNFLTVK